VTDLLKMHSFNVILTIRCIFQHLPDFEDVNFTGELPVSRHVVPKIH